MIELDFEKNHGLIPTIVQDSTSRQVLMLAYMSKASLERTLASGLACYYSRSRQELWTKGETSHYQHVEAIYVDCDADTLLLLVRQEGAACHTGHQSCFYRTIKGEESDE